MRKLDYMNLNTCDRCGSVYETFLESNYCPECHRILEEKLDNVRTFIKHNPETSLEEVEVAFKVERKFLVAWIRESRLQFPKGSGVVVPCLKCGAAIDHGKYCAHCRHEMVTTLDSAYEKKERVKGHLMSLGESHRMRILNRKWHKGKRD